jgi:hypothetical protein
VQLRDDDFWAAWSVVRAGRASRAGLEAALSALGGRLRVWIGGGYTAYGAALAVLLRHTIGQGGFTQAHYDALVKPWVAVTGMMAHPDDAMSRPDGMSTPVQAVATSVTEEIGALSAVVDAIAPLDQESQQRVINYLRDRFTAAF